MKAYKTTKTYKEEYKSWTQPAFSSNTLTKDGVWYQITASKTYSTNYPWKAFDGSTAGNNGWWTGNTTVSATSPHWICLECDHKLKLTSVKLKGDTNGAENPKAGTIQVSNDGVTWKDVGSFTFSGNTAGLEVTCSITVDKGYRFYRVHCTSKFADGVMLGEITYTGQIATETRQSNIKVLTVTEKRTAKVTICKMVKGD